MSALPPPAALQPNAGRRPVALRPLSLALKWGRLHAGDSSNDDQRRPGDNLTSGRNPGPRSRARQVDAAPELERASKVARPDDISDPLTALAPANSYDATESGERAAGQRTARVIKWPALGHESARPVARASFSRAAVLCAKEVAESLSLAIISTLFQHSPAGKYHTPPIELPPAPFNWPARARRVQTIKLDDDDYDRRRTRAYPLHRGPRARPPTGRACVVLATARARARKVPNENRAGGRPARANESARLIIVG